MDYMMFRIDSLDGTKTGGTMKRIILLLLLMQTACGVAYSAEQYTRVGVAFGGTGLISFIVERHIGHMSVRMNIGVLEFKEKVYSLALSVNGYAGDGDKLPHAGIGVLSMFGKYDGNYETLFGLDFPVGLDCRFGNGHALDLEVDILYKRRTGGAMPFPGLFYKYRLWVCIDLPPKNWSSSLTGLLKHTDGVS